MSFVRKAADGPPELNSIDERIGVRSGSTVALDAMLTRIGATGKIPPNDLHERIEELTRENSRLRLEVQFYRDCFVHAQRFLSSIGSISERIEEWFADVPLSRGHDGQLLFEVGKNLIEATQTVRSRTERSQEAWEAFYTQRSE